MFFFGLGFPYNPLKTKKGTLFIPRFLPGLVADLPVKLRPGYKGCGVRLRST